MSEFDEQKFDNFENPTTVRKGARLAIWVFLIGLIAFFFWASVAKIDQVTRAQGQIVASDHIKVIQAPDQGIITKLYVKEGDVVKTGKLLVALEKERAQVAVDDSNAKVAALKISLTRLQAEVLGKPLVFSADLAKYTEYMDNQRQLYRRRKEAIDAEVGSLNRLLGLAKEELQLNQQLEASGDVSYSEILKLKRTTADLAAQIENKKNKYFQDAQAEMTKVQEDLNSRTEELRDRSQILSHTEILAPVDGVVKSMKITTESAVVRSGDVIMEILPSESNLIIEAKTRTEDIANIQLNQTASVKLDAYDYSIYGVMEGVVSYISPDTLYEDTPQGPKPYYRVKILVKDHRFKGRGNSENVRLLPGMTAMVEIKAKERTVLSYLTKPITKTLSQSFGEK